MNDRWYYKSPDGIRGPIDSEELAALVGAGHLTPETLIRHGTGGAWGPATEMLIATTSEGADQAAARVLANVNWAAVRRPVDAASSRRSPFRLLTVAWHHLSGVGDGLASIIRAVVGLIGRSLGRKSVLAILSVLFFGMLIWNVPAFDPPVSDAHGRIVAIWNEARSLRDGAATPQERDEVAAQFTADLATLVEELEETHRKRQRGLWAVTFGPGRSAWARRVLIQVAKHDLPAALQAGPEEADRYDALVDGRLAKADQYAVLAAVYSDSAAAAKDAPTPNPAMEKSNDHLLTGLIIAVDVALIGSIAFFWWRMRRTVA